MSKYFKYLSTTIFTLLICIIPVCNAIGNESNSQRKVKVGGDFDYKPFSYLDENGEAKGFDIDIIKAIALKNNFDIEFHLIKWNEALESLEKGEIDILVSILFTESRKEIFDFTIPHTEEFYAIFVRDNSTIHEISDLSGKSIVSLKGDASIENFIKPMGFFENTKLINSLPLAIRLLSEGKHDAVLAPYSIGIETLVSEGIKNIKAVGPPIIPSLYRFAVKKGNHELLSILNDGIDYLKASGIKDELREKWNFHKRDEVAVTRILHYMVYISILFFLGFTVFFLWTWSLKRTVKIKTQMLEERNIQLENLNVTKDKLFSVIAHDLRSHFSCILGFSDLLLDYHNEFDHSKQREFLIAVNQTAKNSLDMLNNLLLWAKSQIGQLSFKPEMISLSDAIQAVIAIIEPSAKLKNIDISFSSTQDVFVNADNNMISSILLNLLSNAIKFSNENGSINVTLSTNQHEVQISVADNGVGISEEFKSKLIRVLSNTSAKEVSGEGGTGLGLVICKEFVEKHNGTIWLESNEGKGSEFSFTIPYKQSIIEDVNDSYSANQNNLII